MRQGELKEGIDLNSQVLFQYKKDIEDQGVQSLLDKDFKINLVKMRKEISLNKVYLYSR